MLVNVLITETSSLAALLPLYGMLGLAQDLLVALCICLLVWFMQRTRRRAELAKRQLETVLEAFPEAVSVYDSSGRLVQCNRATRTLMLSKPWEAIRQREKGVSKSWESEAIDGTPLMHEQFPLMRSLKGETVVGYEVRYLDGRKQGQVLAVDSTPIYRGDGKIEGAVLIAHDLSPLSTIKREVMEQTRKFQALLNSITDAAYILDSGGHVVQANSSARLALIKLEAGTMSSALLLYPTFECQILDAQGMFLSLDALPTSRLLRGEALIGEQMVEVRVRYLDEQDLRLNVCGAPMFDEEGCLCGAVVIMRDVTERKILTCQEEAQYAAQQHMDQFLGIVSHELRTPLTTISISLQYSRSLLNNTANTLLEDDPLRLKLQEVHQLLTRAERQVSVQNRIINDLFDVSHLQSSRFSLRLAPCDLFSTLQILVADFQSLHPEREIRLVPLTHVEDLTVIVDVERISQVINNYMNNACKYTPSSAAIEVRIITGDKEVCVGVKDEGPGLAPDEQERVWELFYRVPGIEPNKGTSKGAGLGLYICRTIIEQHQGQVGVESAPGAGSIFWFTIPLADGQ